MLVDVREADEWCAGHAACAMHLSVNAVAAGAVPTEDTRQKIYTYCASGGRAVLSGKALREMGYECVYNLGGFKDALEGGFPSENG